MWKNLILLKYVEMISIIYFKMEMILWYILIMLATSYPKPKVVYDAIMDAMMEYGANPGRSGHKKALKASRGIFDTKVQNRKAFKCKKGPYEYNIYF